MPLYHYRCETCKAEFEELQGIHETPLEECINIECGGKVQRMVGDVRIGICDTSMLRDARKSREQFDEKTEKKRNDLYEKKAKAAGVSTTGKWYHPGLALEVGDPMAWVGSIQDIIEVCRIRGWDYKYEEGELKIIQKMEFGKTVKESVESAQGYKK